MRFEDDLIPFDVIPCRPKGGFLQFIADTLAAGHSVTAVRTASNLLSALVAELTGSPHHGKVSVPSASSTGRPGRPRKSL